MEFTEKEYQQMSKKASPGSPVGKNCALAFLVGGLLCALAEVECQLLVRVGTELTVARTLSSCSLILLSAVLTAFQVFDNIAKHAGAGTLVPITGFANSVVAPAIEFKSEGFILGLGAKMFTIAGPVIVYGTVASVVYGVVYWIMQML